MVQMNQRERSKGKLENILRQKTQHTKQYEMQQKAVLSLQW